MPTLFIVIFLHRVIINPTNMHLQSITSMEPWVVLNAAPYTVIHRSEYGGGGLKTHQLPARHGCLNTCDDWPLSRGEVGSLEGVNIKRVACRQLTQEIMNYILI